MVTALELTRLYGVKAKAAIDWVIPINTALALSECNTPYRTACWLAQVGHESGRLVYTKELWGPTKQQLKYEPTTKLSKQLGNTEPGDGLRYRGRGLIQTTGRSNYAMTTVKLRKFFKEVPDFESNPQLLETKFWAAMSAAIYWRSRSLNKWADKYDFAELTRRINGGYNGMADRQALLARALIVLGV